MSAARSERFLSIARRYAARRVSRDLDGFEAAGLRETAELASRRPVLLVANHVAWWDSFVCLLIDRALGTEGYALMEEANLRRLPFFSWVGAIPLDPARPARGLRLGGRLLDRPGRAVWVFAQGEQRPAHLRPLGFAGGVELLARLAPDAALVPVALQYAFLESQRPAAFASLGPPVSSGSEPGGLTQRLEAAVADQLEQIDGRLRGDGAGFEAVVPRRGGPPEAGAGARLLAALRPPVRRG